MSSALDRLVAVAARTGLPTIVSSTDAAEPCVLVPLSVYERLVGVAPSSAPPVLPVMMTDRVDEESVNVSTESSESVGGVSITAVSSPSLEDFLMAPAATQGSSQPVFIPPIENPIPTLPAPSSFLSNPAFSATGSFLPQSEALEDRLAGEGQETMFLSDFSQKIVAPTSRFDEFGQTLA